MESPPPSPRRKRPPAVHWALDSLGVTLVAIGAVGVVTPGLPTTVFWIGAVVCFLKTRPWAVKPLLKTPVVGPAIIGFLRWKPFGGGRARKKRPSSLMEEGPGMVVGAERVRKGDRGSEPSETAH